MKGKIGRSIEFVKATALGGVLFLLPLAVTNYAPSISESAIR